MKNSRMKLSEVGKELPFSVPEDYFDNFYTNLKSKLDEDSFEPIKKQKVFYLNFKRSVAVAATIFLFILMLVQPTDIKRTNDYSIEDYFLGMDDYSLYSLFEPVEEEELSEEEIFDYLSLTVSDYELYVELNK